MIEPPADIPWSLVGTTKLIVMSFVTFQIYPAYWFYRNWKIVRESTGQRLHPVFRAVLAVLYCHSMFARIAESARDAGVERTIAPAHLTLAFVALNLTIVLPFPYSMLTFLSVLPVATTARLASAAVLHRDPGAERNSRLTSVNWVGVAIGGPLLVLFVVAGIYQDALVNRVVRSEMYLSMVAFEANRSLPKRLDDDTELQVTVGLEGTIVYYCRMVNDSAADLDPQTFERILKPQVIASACATPEARDNLLRHGVTLRYVYRDKVGVELVSFDVTPGMCGF